MARTIATERPRAGALPSAIAGLVGWFKADQITPVADGTTIGTWADQSVSAADLTQGTEASKPTYRLAAIGTQPALRFDGSNDVLTTTVAGLATAFSGSDLPFTVFVVGTKASNNSDDVAVGWVNVADTGTIAVEHLTSGATALMVASRRDDAASIVNTSTTQTLDLAAHIRSWVFPGTTLSVFLDGAATSVAGAVHNAGVCTFGLFRVGGGIASTASRYHGDIAEVIVFNRALKDWERVAVETHLSAKYAIVVAGATITRTIATSRPRAGTLPSSIPGLLAWYDAAAITPVADGTALDTWADRSGAAEDLTGTTTTRPLYKTNIINGLPVVRFDGIDDKMVKTSSATAAALSGEDHPLTYIAVIKKATNNTSDVICAAIAAGDGASAAMHTLQTSAADAWQSSRVSDGASTVAPTASTGPGTNPRIFTNVFTGTTASFFADGAATNIAGTAQDVGTATLGTFRLGAGRNSGNPYDGDIAELIVYSRALASWERLAVETYLSAKWGITVAGVTITRTAA